MKSLIVHPFATLLLAVMLPVIGCSDNPKNSNSTQNITHPEKFESPESLFNAAFNAAEAGNYAEAARLYRILADQNHAEARLHLANLHLLGRGVQQDSAEAARLVSLAADQGFNSAQLNLGTFYYNGWSVPKDKVRAYKWYYIAATNGNETAMELRDQLASEMTPDQLAEGQRLASARAQY